MALTARALRLVRFDVTVFPARSATILDSAYCATVSKLVALEPASNPAVWVFSQLLLAEPYRIRCKEIPRADPPHTLCQRLWRGNPWSSQLPWESLTMRRLSTPKHPGAQRKMAMTELLREDKDRGEMHTAEEIGGAKRPSSACAETNGGTEPLRTSSGGTKQKRIRWWLALLLYHNPSLAEYRDRRSRQDMIDAGFVADEDGEYGEKIREEQLKAEIDRRQAVRANVFRHLEETGTQLQRLPSVAQRVGDMAKASLPPKLQQLPSMANVVRDGRWKNGWMTMQKHDDRANSTAAAAEHD
ncbi:hypothetical protein CYMTET_29273 [Cymbomonas tetramitiformis]|uniref:Uncharacterized protein n=1 Tax=Cymbomonas tetramitiformis TaxID=36881 RepID=A0AAE0FLS3_9CHLO|nr:hypothetical protein CYMTET_29273 [Cymbomonas tetramitiformis]